MMTSSSAAAASCIGEGEVQPQAAAAASRGQQDNDDNNDDERQQAIDCFNAPTWCDFEKMMNGEQNSLSDAYLSDFFDHEHPEHEKTNHSAISCHSDSEMCDNRPEFRKVMAEAEVLIKENSQNAETSNHVEKEHKVFEDKVDIDGNKENVPIAAINTINIQGKSSTGEDFGSSKTQSITKTLKKILFATPKKIKSKFFKSKQSTSESSENLAIKTADVPADASNYAIAKPNYSKNPASKLKSKSTAFLASKSSLTVPQSPMLATKERALLTPRTKRKLSMSSMMNHNRFMLKPFKPKTTDVEPFCAGEKLTSSFKMKKKTD